MPQRFLPGWGFPYAAFALAVLSCDFANRCAGSIRNGVDPGQHRYQLATHESLRQRSAAPCLAGLDRSPGISDADRFVPTHASGAKMVLAQVQLVANAAFDLLRRRGRDPRLLLHSPARSQSLARVRAAGAAKCCAAVPDGAPPWPAPDTDRRDVLNLLTAMCDHPSGALLQSLTRR